jgi:hypothetical protein
MTDVRSPRRDAGTALAVWERQAVKIIIASLSSKGYWTALDFAIGSPSKPLSIVAPPDAITV